MALQIEKLKAPLFPGPEGTGDTNGWCITEKNMSNSKIYGTPFLLKKIRCRSVRAKIVTSYIFCTIKLFYRVLAKWTLPALHVSIGRILLA